jgi:uncharacterized membrane protein YvlD (DUF360 family)
MKFLLRFTANTIAVYLMLYLVDSVTKGRFLVGAVWVAVFLAVLLGFMNSFIKPLPRVKTKTVRALVVTALTLVANALLVQIFAWATPLSAANLSWVLAATVFIVVVTGIINWLVGFGVPEKARQKSTITHPRDTQARKRVRETPKPPSRSWRR